MTVSWSLSYIRAAMKRIVLSVSVKLNLNMNECNINHFGGIKFHPEKEIN